MLIFLKGETAKTADLARHHLETLTDEGRIEWSDCQNGPTGLGAGALGTFQRSRQSLSAMADGRPRIGPAFDASYVWQVVRPGVVVGWQDAHPPTPDELARSKQLPGEWLRLGDGNEWLIPHAAQLPFTLGIGDGSEVAPEVRRQYPLFLDQAYAALAAIADTKDGNAAVDNADLLGLVVFALTVNYRLTHELATALGLLDNEAVRAALLIILESQAVRDVTRGKPTLRGATYRSWRGDLLPGYVPRVADLYLFAKEGAAA